MTKLYGLMIVKDEADIVEQSIVHAMQYCSKIIVIDNMSSDGTWELIEQISKRHPARIIALVRTAEPFHDGLRAIGYNAFHEELSSADWWLRLDADEFLHEDPAGVIDIAARENADFIRANMINFALTDVDLQAIESGSDARSAPIGARRRYYRVGWREFRLFRNNPAVKWNDKLNQTFPQNLFGGRRKVCSTSIFMRHYSNRDVDQVRRRVAIRAESSAFSHISTENWRDAMFLAKNCHYYTPGSAIAYNPLLDFWPKRIGIEILNRVSRFPLNARMVSFLAALRRRLR